MSQSISLYEISTEYAALVRQLEELDLPPEEVAALLDAYQAPLEQKAKNVAMYIGNLKATQTAIQNEIARLNERVRKLEERHMSIRRYLHESMERCGITKIECDLFTLAIRKNPCSLVVDMETEIPTKFFTQKQVISLDKNAVKEALKAGQDVPGAHLEQTTRLEIR